MFLRAAKVSGWALAWLGAGKAALLVGDLNQAEAGLSEANTRSVLHCPSSYRGALCLLFMCLTLCICRPQRQPQRRSVGVAVPHVLVCGKSTSSGGCAVIRAVTCVGTCLPSADRQLAARGSGLGFRVMTVLSATSACIHRVWTSLRTPVYC